MNPFVIKGYKGAQYFCNRIEESDSLVNAIRNNQDITLYGYRRLGKSALIQHVFSKLNKEFFCIYTDIVIEMSMNVNNGGEWLVQNAWD